MIFSVHFLKFNKIEKQTEFPYTIDYQNQISIISFFFQKQISKMRNSNNINLLNEFLINKKHMLGKGATGQVYAGKQLKDNSDVAVKIIDIKTIDNEVTQYLLNMEKIAVMSCSNPHVLRGIKIVQNNLFCYIITEMCNGGTLKNAIKISGHFGEEQSLKILIQLLKGTCSLIGKGIIHRDLKPANILLHNGQTKIIDFGYCQIKGYPKPNLQYNVGSPSYMSPQAFLHNQYSQKSQIWAIGVTFYECLNGKTFDDGKHMSEVFKQIRAKGLPYKVQVSDKCKTIINWCLQTDPKKRPTSTELLNYVVSDQIQIQRQPSYSTSQTTRLSFKPLDNIDIKVKVPQKNTISKPNSEYFMKNIYKKEDLLKTQAELIQNKKRALFSSYQPKKLISDKQTVDKDKRNTVYHTKSKYEKNHVNYDTRPTVYRHKSQLFQIQNNMTNYMGIRTKSKENIFGMNPARAKISNRPIDGHKYRMSTHIDYYGMISER